MRLTKEQQRDAERLGGTENRSIYTVPDTRPSCDAFGHAERSRHNDQGQHDRHWKKEEKK